MLFAGSHKIQRKKKKNLGRGKKFAVRHLFDYYTSAAYVSRIQVPECLDNTTGASCPLAVGGRGAISAPNTRSASSCATSLRVKLGSFDLFREFCRQKPRSAYKKKSLSTDHDGTNQLGDRGVARTYAGSRGAITRARNQWHLYHFAAAPIRHGFPSALLGKKIRWSGRVGSSEHKARSKLHP